MKKLLIGLTVLFSFLFISDVSALTVLGTYTIKEDILNSELYYNDYGTDYKGHTTYYDALIASGKFESFHEEAMKRGYKYYFYTSDSIFMWNDEDIKIVMSLKTTNTNNGYTLDYGLVNPNNSRYVNYWLHYWINDNKMEGMNNDYERHNITIGIRYNTKDYNQYGLSKYHFPGFNTNTDIYYYPSIASSPSNNSKLAYYSSISINGKTYNDGDVIYSPKKEPKINSYSNSFDTTNIDFIRFKFDVNDLIDNENFIQFDYNLSGNYIETLAYPYIETLYDYYLTADDNETSTVLYKTYELSSYTNTIFENVNQDLNATVYYNFVVDTRKFNDNLSLNFSSYYNYEVEIYKSDGTTEVLYQIGPFSLSKNNYLPDCNMVTLDLTDYVGIVLMPKVFSTTDNLGLIYNAIKYDQFYRVFLNGVYDIYIRSTPSNYVTLTDTFKDYSNLYFSKRFKYVSFTDNKNTNLIRFVKTSSSYENYTITFDSNMYSYSLISSSDEVVILPDANLPDNTINTGTVDEDVSLDEANNVFIDAELSITNFINDIDETLQYVHNVFNLFFNKLPRLIQALLVFVFNILCIFMLLRMGGWLG